ncbi:MAG: cell envelope integrity protein CreD, partial [Kiloniellales bacterium]
MNTEQLARTLKDPRYQSYVKLGILAFLVLASLLPLQKIRDLVIEREKTGDAAAREIAVSWGGEQRIAGPVLVLPVTANSAGRAATPDSDTGISYTEDGENAYDDRRHIFVLPDMLEIESEVRPSKRHRGIYETVVYTSGTRISGSFAQPDLGDMGVNDAKQIDWSKARIEVFLTDFHGIMDVGNLDWNGSSLPFRTGDPARRNIVASLPLLNAGPGQWPARFSFTLDLKGSRTFGFSPFGGKTRVTLRSAWPHPSFFGGYLPTESTVTTDGFDARWELSNFERELPVSWLGDDDGADKLLLRAHNRGILVLLMDPVDHYLKSERSVKYGILFVILVSCMVFAFEIMSGARVHPVQYGMVAAALCLFFLLLLSLSEVVGFGA